MVINGRKHRYIPGYFSMLRDNNPLTYKISYSYILGNYVILEKDPYLGHDIKKQLLREWKVPISTWQDIGRKTRKLPWTFNEMVEALNPPPPPPPPRTYLDDRDHIGMVKAIFIEYLMKRIIFLTEQRAKWDKDFVQNYIHLSGPAIAHLHELRKSWGLKPYTIVEYAVFQLTPTAPKPFFEDVTKLQAKVHVLGSECEKEIERLRDTDTDLEWGMSKGVSYKRKLCSEKRAAIQREIDRLTCCGKFGYDWFWRFEQVAGEKAKIDDEIASFPTWLKPLFKMIDEQRRMGEEAAKPRQLVYKSGEFVNSEKNKSEALEKRMSNFFKKFPEAEKAYEEHERKVSELKGIYNESLRSNKRYEKAYKIAEMRLQGGCKDSDG
jgi:hypothetical protein